MMNYPFYGSKNANVKAICSDFPGIITPNDLYVALSHLWSKKTCAPRLQETWSKENMTLGQCSITAFLAQDIFGGDVFGIPLKDGNFHCFNVINDISFDLTSEQFQNQKLDYDHVVKQSRQVHFAKDEKRLRYEHLKSLLKQYCQAKKENQR